MRTGVEVGQRSGQGGDPDPGSDGRPHHPAPGRQRLADLLGEGRIEAQQRQIRIGPERGVDPIEQTRPDDAARLPDPGDLGQIGAVPLLDGAGPHQGEALGVAHDLRGIQGALQIIDPDLGERGGARHRIGEDLGGSDPQGLGGRQCPGLDRGDDGGQGDAGLDGVDGGPAAGALLARHVLDPNPPADPPPGDPWPRRCRR